MSVISQFPDSVQAVFSEYILNEWVVTACRPDAIWKICVAFLQQNGRATVGVDLLAATLEYIGVLRGRAAELNLGMEHECAYALAMRVQEIEVFAIHRVLHCSNAETQVTLRKLSTRLDLTEVQVLQRFGGAITKLTIYGPSEFPLVVPEAIEHLPHLETLALIASGPIRLTGNLARLLELRQITIQCPERYIPTALAALPLGPRLTTVILDSHDSLARIPKAAMEFRARHKKPELLWHGERVGPSREDGWPCAIQ